MKTTKTQANTDLANRLLEIRSTLKSLKKEESELKEYFTSLMDDDNTLIVDTAIVISRSDRSSWRYDTKTLDYYFQLNDLDCKSFKTESSYSVLSINSAKKVS